ncbi:putative alcohol dehydrogenase [Xylariaceae sp. FL1019]|nr:putative alcohol dehydrogenase [Xylariaceae sp. FL1019]
MATIRAIVLVSEKTAGIRDVPMPKIRDEWVLVKTKAVAVNPTDWKHVDFSWTNVGSRIGCDYAGIVVAVGSKVAGLEKGDRVAGFCQGSHSYDHETGAFGDFVLAKSSAQFKIPDNMSFERAASVPVSMFTCAGGLYESLGLPLPNAPSDKQIPVLIHGGSTATGVLGIQFAKASGLFVVTTASPRNFEYLKSVGADAVFDYKSPSCGEDIRMLTNNSLKYAWDCVGGGEEICGKALSSSERSKYGTINFSDGKLLNEINPLTSDPTFYVALDAVDEPYSLRGSHREPPKHHAEFATMFKEIARDLLQSGRVQPINIDVNRGGPGLEGVLKGLDELRNGKVSAQKLVYTL